MHGQGVGVVTKVVGARPRPWGRGQDLWGVAKAVRADTNPNTNSNPKAVEALSRPWGCGRGRGGVAKALVLCQGREV